jgi:hypothetical protein
LFATLQAKIAGAAVGAAIFVALGIWIGHRFDLGTIAALRATIAQQQAADAQATAKVNALAAQQLASAQTEAQAAENAIIADQA